MHGGGMLSSYTVASILLFIKSVSVISQCDCVQGHNRSHLENNILLVKLLNMAEFFHFPIKTWEITSHCISDLAYSHVRRSTAIGLNQTSFLQIKTHSGTTVVA